MFKISRRQTILRASILGCLVVAVLSTAAYFIINQQKESNAITKLDDRVDVIYDPSDSGLLKYGNAGSPNPPNTAHNTRHYNVQVANGTQFDGYCAQPKNGSPVTDPDDPEDYYKAKLLSNSSRDGNGGAIKLIMYLDQHNPGNEIFNAIEDSASWGDNRAHRRYVFTHAVIGALYSNPGDYKGLDSQEQTRVDNAIDQLRVLIERNDPAWQQADTYQLYRTQTKKGTQDVVWLEQTGKIIIQKCDADNTGACIRQGDGNFDNITFTLTQGATVIAAQTLTNGAQTITFTGLDPDLTYTVTESGSNSSYNLTASAQSAKPTPTGTTLTFRNTIKRGKLTVNKIDKDTGSCTNTKGLSFAGTTFQLVNVSANSVYYNNTAIARGAVVTTRTMNEGECSITFDNLPYGTYNLQETVAARGYVLDNTPRTITIHPNSDTDPPVEYTFENQPIRGDLRFVKKDPNNNTVIPNAIFEITSISNNYAESHIVVSDENGIVDTSANLHSINTNGYDDPYYHYQDDAINLPYAGYGTWFGIDNNNQPINVRDDVGALPYGTYLIQEKRCDQFIFCQNVNNEKRVFSITEHGVVASFEDIDGDGEGDWNNDCAEFTLATTATDNSDGDHYIEAGQDTVIKDVVNYCAKAGFTFTIKGTLMDKSTNQPLLINGEPVEQSVEISPTDNDCGTVELLFPLNSSDLVGKSIVVFEKLYYKNDVKSSHEDINDPDQTVDIVSLKTTAKNEENGEQFFVEGEEEVTIIDTVEYCFTKEKPIVVKGVLMNKNTGEPLLINGEKVEQSASVLHARDENCGTLDLSFTIEDTTDLSGTPIVVYETLYEIVPVPGGGDGEGTEEEAISHKDINDEKQTVYPINLSTTVQPNEDGSKVFPLNSDITITDMVHYCLQPGKEYTVKGVVMDKSTGNGLLVNSSPVEQSITFTPTEYCSEIPMQYSFNTRGLTGAQLVIFETLYYNDEPLIEHRDLDNEDESFEIDINPPETGYAAKMSTGTTETTHTELLVIAVFAITPVVIYSASHHFAKRKITFRK